MIPLISARKTGIAVDDSQMTAGHNLMIAAYTLNPAEHNQRLVVHIKSIGGA